MPTVLVLLERLRLQGAAAAENNDMLSSADRAITGNFANNRGRLPMPLSGQIVSHFGQYNVAGMSNIRLNNDGINIKGAPGVLFVASLWAR